VANLSILKNGHARAIRFSTLTAIRHALGCTPGKLLSLHDEQAPRRRAGG
jgi:putative transcriptional regulator